MTRDKAIAELVRIWHSPHLDLSLKTGLGEAIDALKENNRIDSLVRDEAENCKESESKLDLISRQDAIKAIRSTVAQYVPFLNGVNKTLPMECEIALRSVPSAEPKTGEWIDIDNYYSMATCSHCHKVTMFEKWGEYIRPYNFCPNCGARMDGGEEE